MRNQLVLTAALLCTSLPVHALSITLGTPNISIGFTIPSYPELQPIPGYPAYYAPNLDANYFFYDGMYWIFRDDNWYASTWYDGPWGRVEQDYVPVYVLRIPVRYYRRPPAYFSPWASDSAPRWGEHYGSSWRKRHLGWDRWARGSVPRRPPLPAYQRDYSGSAYPDAQQQNRLHGRNYTYRPQTQAVRQGYQQLQNQRNQDLLLEQQRASHEQHRRDDEQRANAQRQEQQRRDIYRQDQNRQDQNRQDQQRQEQNRHDQQRRDNERNQQIQRDATQREQDQQRHNQERDAQNRRDTERRAQSLAEQQQRQTSLREDQERKERAQRAQNLRDGQQRQFSLKDAQDRRAREQRAVEERKTEERKTEGRKTEERKIEARKVQN